MSTARKKKHGHPHLSAKAGLARQQFQESQHPRGMGGRFADKAGAGNDAPKRSRGRAEVQPRSPEESGGAAGGVKTRVMSAKSTLRIVVSGNPKKGTAAKRFALYKDGMTIQDYVDAVGDKKQALRDLAWDMKQGWIKSPDAGTIVVRPAKTSGGEKAKYKPGSEEYKSKNTAPLSKNARLSEDHQLYLEVGSNPKRAGAAKRFDFYKDGMTVREYIEKVGDKRQALKDIAWDTKQGFISAKGPGTAAKKPDTKADTKTTGAGDSGTRTPGVRKPDVRPPETKPVELPKKPEAVDLAEIVSKRSLTENLRLTDNHIDSMRRSVLDHMDAVYRVNRDSPEITRLAKLHQDLGDLRSNLNKRRTEDTAQRREAAARSDVATTGVFRGTRVYTAKNGMKAHIGENVSTEFAESILGEMDKIPKHAAAILAKGGLETHIGKNVTETPIFRKLGIQPTDRPRGYTEGSDFYNVGGFYNPTNRVIAMGEEFRYTGRQQFSKNTMARDTMLHEAGHAYDRAAGGAEPLSKSRAFMEAYEKDVADINKNPKWAQIRSDQSYFLQSGDAGRSEVFAEGFMEVTRGTTGYDKSTRIHEHFPRSAALIGKILETGERAYG